MKRSIYVFIFFSLIVQGQNKVFDYFFVSNTISPTCFINDEAGQKMKVEVLLDTKANIAKVPFNYQFASNNTLVGGNESLPINFSGNFKQNFQVKNSQTNSDMILELSVKQIKPRKAPFKISFTESYTPNSWTTSTQGWVTQATENVSLSGVLFKNDKSTFILALSNAQELLSFDLETLEEGNSEGTFTVEVSETGMSGSWNTLFLKDSCNSGFSKGKSTVRLLLSENDRFIRFVLSKSQDNKRAVVLNNFSLSRYNNEELGEFSKVFSTSHDKWNLISNYGFSNLELIVPENVSEWMYSIVDLQGKTIQSDKNKKLIDIDHLNTGVYILYIYTNINKIETLKFIKI